MPELKADLMRRLRRERKESGLVKVEVWVMPQHKAEIKKLEKTKWKK